MHIKDQFNRMKDYGHLAIIITTLSSASAVLSASVNKPMQITVTTSLLRCAVEEIGGSHVSVHMLIKPEGCPGHFDITPRDMSLLTNSRVIFSHGYEGFIASAAKAHKLRVTPIDVQGNWMKPEVYISALSAVTTALSKVDSAHRNKYQVRLKKLTQKYLALSKSTRAKLSSIKLSGTKVLCSAQQYEFVAWMGLSVAGTYGASDDFTPRLLHQLTRIGKAQHVKLCIDNLQSDPIAGRQVAKDIGAEQVTVSNFPGGFAGTSSWQACFNDNIRRITTALARKRQR